ncbi:hypothetical protein IH601_05325 [Candidatus Bipolaricaulota bacterium]|nr:hypothetical protein [Candidatus Bipolaricaulota bacterium]TFH07907.1 MAG: hypothetical protein E4H08_08715 [Candidatus Atribacteria bacterium]
MQRRGWRLVGVCLAVAVTLLLVAVAATGAAPCGCETVTVSGAGDSSVNGMYTYLPGARLALTGYVGKWWIGPSYEMQGLGTFNWVFFGGSGGWIFGLAVEDGPIDQPLQPCTKNCAVFVDLTSYQHAAGSSCPPATGWTGSPGPVPTISLDACVPPEPVTITIIPTGEAGPDEFLDAIVALAEDATPPMIGELPLSAIHPVGDIISGSCQILGSSELPTGASFVHVYIQSVDISTHPETLVLLDHWMASYNRLNREFEFAWDTEGLAPGHYDIRLFFQDGSAVTFRIQLTPAVE